MSIWQICLLVAAIVWSVIVIFALALGKTAGDADEAAARMFADHCPDEVEP